MRIAYLCADPGIPVLGHKGASVHLRSLASALQRHGHEVLLAASAVEGENPPPIGVVMVRLPDDPADATTWLTSGLRDWRADVVLERYSLESGPGERVARQLGVPFVLEVNAPLVDEAARFSGLTNIEAWRARERGLLLASDRVVAVSSGVRDHVLRAGVPPARVVVVHNGVDATLFAGGRGNAIRRRYGLRGMPVIGFAGSLKAWHGVRTLVLALAGLPESVHLLVVGDGPQREDIEALATTLDVSGRLRMAGAVPHDRMPDYLAAMDIAVAPYEPQPGFYFSPLKVIEYMAAGLPVVASDQGDLPDIVGDAGLLIPPGDEPALRDALSRLLTDERARREMSFRARRRARAMSWDSVAREVEGVLAPMLVSA
ncbi:MAG TPA: glycosyltransferase family 4 protein [Candidatus Acidoferrum sp.]|nr:glycosyltransferase family 4 protein [Candidatus Acidoferrum sp.]